MKVYRCLIAAVAIAFSAVVARADDALLIKPLFGASATFGLPAPGGYFAARIPIALDKDGIGQKKIDIVMSHVTSPKGSNPAWEQCVKSGFVRPEGSTLALLLNDTCGLAPATYEVTITVSASNKEQRLVFQVTRPAAEIRPLGTQTVERIDTLFDVTTQPKALTVMETSGRSPLSNVSALRVDDVTVDGHPIGGDIVFTKQKQDENGIVRLPLHLTGDYPYGKAKATVALRAAELTAPTYVSYEIQNRLTAWLLLPVIFAGLLLGYLTRTILKGFLERRKARIAALDLLDKMKREQRRYRDAEFTDQVGRLIVDLEGALKGPADTLTTSVNDISAKFTTAVTTLQQNIVDTNKAIESASQSLPQVYDFPTDITTAIKTAVAGFTDAHETANGGNPKLAAANLRLITETLTHDVREAAATWRDKVRNATATTPKVALPPGIEPQFTNAVGALNTQLAQIPAADVAATLSAVSQARFTIRHDVVQGAFDQLARYAQKTIDDIKQGGGTAASSEAALKKLQDAIRNDDETTLQTEMEAVDPLLTALANEKAAAGAAAKPPLLSGIATSTPTTDAARSAMATLLPSPEPTFIQRFFSTPAMRQYDSIDVDRKRTFTEILVAELASFVIASIGITIAGVIFLLPTFDGTPRGLLTAFFWGYAGDISVDALTEAAKKYRS